MAGIDPLDNGAFTFSAPGVSKDGNCNGAESECGGSALVYLEKMLICQLGQHMLNSFAYVQMTCSVPHVLALSFGQY